MNESKAFEDVLRRHGRRATPQRRWVYDAVAELGHCTPEQVCEQVRQQAPGLNLSTVYRTLEILEEIGVVTHTHLGHGAPTYHPADHADHLHLVCRRCGAVTEAPMHLATGLCHQVQLQAHFSVDLAHISLHGLCQHCQTEEQEPSHGRTDH